MSTALEKLTSLLFILCISDVSFKNFLSYLLLSYSLTSYLNGAVNVKISLTLNNVLLSNEGLIMLMYFENLVST